MRKAKLIAIFEWATEGALLYALPNGEQFAETVFYRDGRSDGQPLRYDAWCSGEGCDGWPRR